MGREGRGREVWLKMGNGEGKRKEREEVGQKEKKNIWKVDCSREGVKNQNGKGNRREWWREIGNRE